MGDRHARPYKPSQHHAKLAVNAASNLCEFLLDVFESLDVIGSEKPSVQKD